MTNEKEENLPTKKRWGKTLASEDEDFRKQLPKDADDLREEMESQSLLVRDLILVQPPVQLLGYLTAKRYMVFCEISEMKDEESKSKRKGLLQTFQFALEYVHAIWSSHTDLVDEKTSLDELKVAALFEALEQLKSVTMRYCMVSSAVALTEPGQNLPSKDAEFYAKSTWVLIRGNRHQVLEEEFFKFILEPHSDALLKAYDMGSDAIAAAIQAIVNSMRVGFSEAIEVIDADMDKARVLSDESSGDLGSAVEQLMAGHEVADENFSEEMSGAIHDLLHGGICSLSRHTNLTPLFLEDFCYLPGQNTEFFADGDFRGTPMRTLPALIKPGIKLGDEYYVTDGQFVRDAAYRAIQRGLLKRLPEYKDEWNQRQKSISEHAYPTIFSHQLSCATTYSEVYFKDPKTNRWAETDLVLTLADVLLVVEAKAGVMAMHSPATNFDQYERAIRELIIKAYKQCKRFIEYLASSSEVPLYKFVDGEYVEIVLLRQQDFRLILPIGLTVEAFTPFSSMSKEFTEIQPLLGKYPFISMSIDDLFVLNRFLPSTGELLHYLEVRQQAAGIPNAIILDEIDHLGAYISNNRFDILGAYISNNRLDISIREQPEKYNLVIWDSFCDVVNEYFEGDKWKTEPPPRQDYPQELTAVLSALDAYRPMGWGKTDVHIRNLNRSSRNNFAQTISGLKRSLSEQYIRRFLIFGDGYAMQVWVCRNGSEPSPQEMHIQGQVSCLVADVPSVIVLRLSYNQAREIVDIACTSFSSPAATQPNYVGLMREAERKRARSKGLD